MASIRQVSSTFDATRGTTPGLTSEIADLIRTLQTLVADPYRPELHYMRGPGPKWRAKHDRASAADTTPSVPGLMRANA